MKVNNYYYYTDQPMHVYNTLKRFPEVSIPRKDCNAFNETNKKSMKATITRNIHNENKKSEKMVPDLIEPRVNSDKIFSEQQELHKLCKSSDNEFNSMQNIAKKLFHRNMEHRKQKRDKQLSFLQPSVKSKSNNKIDLSKFAMHENNITSNNDNKEVNRPISRNGANNKSNNTLPTLFSEEELLTSHQQLMSSSQQLFRPSTASALPTYHSYQRYNTLNPDSPSNKKVDPMTGVLLLPANNNNNNTTNSSGGVMNANMDKSGSRASLGNISSDLAAILQSIGHKLIIVGFHFDFNCDTLTNILECDLLSILNSGEISGRYIPRANDNNSLLELQHKLLLVLGMQVSKEELSVLHKILLKDYLKQQKQQLRL